MKKLKKILLPLLFLVLLAGAFLGWRLTLFPGKIGEPGYRADTEGVRQTFRAGVVYRHPGFPPQLEVKGYHYEMGLQYGVLLRPEILAAVDAYADVLGYTAEEMGVPRPLLIANLKYRAQRMAQRLPARFREEIRGVAEGSGVPAATITLLTLLYDVSMTGGCTGLLMRTPDGGIIHGHSQEPYGLGYDGLVEKHTAIVRYRPEGYHAVTHVDPLLFLGVEMGANDRGLTYTEETYSIREPNPDGFPITYLARLALEEAGNLEEVEAMLRQHSVAAPGGMLWSDRDEGRGMRAEILPTAMAVQLLEGPILWNFNNIVDPELARQQQPRSNLAGFNRERERIAQTFPQKPAYTVGDAVAFLRSRRGPDSLDHPRTANRGSIANAWGQEVIVFDPAGDGFYLASGPTFAAWRAFYHYPPDFSRPPALFTEALPVDPALEAAARIRTGMLGSAERLPAFEALADAYPADAYVHFLTAYESFRQERRGLFFAFAKRAQRLAPHVPEYRLYAGLAAWQAGDEEGAIELLEEKRPGEADLSPEEESYRLTALARLWAGRDPERSARYATALQTLLRTHDAVDYYESALRPRLEALAGEAVIRKAKEP